MVDQKNPMQVLLLMQGNMHVFADVIASDFGQYLACLSTELVEVEYSNQLRSFFMSVSINHLRVIQME